MAAPKGNNFWERRSKHGRNKLFASPKLLWLAAAEYFKWCEATPLIEQDFKGAGAKRVILKKLRPFTTHGLCLYLDCNTGYFKDFEDNLKIKLSDTSKLSPKENKQLEEIGRAHV